MPNILPIPAFNDNYIWLIVNPKNRQAAVVDPGDAQVVINALKTKNLRLSAILITHHHHDHTGGIKTLVAETGAEVFGPQSGNISQIDTTLKDNESLELDPLELGFKVITTPGHTLDHICYYNQELLFCGDTLFSGGCGRIFEGSTLQMYDSLMRLAALNPATKVYCAHEYTLDNLQFAKRFDQENSALDKRMAEVTKLRSHNIPSLPSTLECELKTNPFLRCNEPGIINAIEQNLGKKTHSALERFSLLRQWKSQG